MINTGLVQILQGSERLPGNMTLDLAELELDLFGVLEPLEPEPDPVTYRNFVGVASLHGPVAP